MAERPTKLMEQMGVTFHGHNSRRGSLSGHAEAPPGKTFNATGCHSITVPTYIDRNAGWTALAEDLRKGLSDCDDPDCEMCPDDGLVWDNEARTWRAAK